MSNLKDVRAICIKGDIGDISFALQKYPDKIDSVLDEDGNVPLTLCINYGHTKIVTELLKAKANTNIQIVEGNTPLHVATKNNSIKIVKKLLKYSADPSISNNNNITALHIACSNNNLKIAEELLKSKKEIINYETNSKLTALSLSCRVGSLELTKYLISQQANVNGSLQITNNLEESQNWNNYPLHICAVNNEIKLTKLLLKNYVNINQTDNFGFTALHHAIQKGNLEMILLLINQENININLITTKEIHKNILYLATESKNFLIFHNIIQIAHKKLLQHGSFDKFINFQSNDGSTCLFIATKLACFDIINDLIIYGASITLTCFDGMSPLHLACMFGYNEIVKSFLLLLKSENTESSLINSPAGIGSTCLLFASEEGHTDIVKMLIHANCDINYKRNLDGATAVFMSCLEGKIDVLKELLRVHASIFIGSPQTGVFPLFIACQQGYIDIFNCLTEHILLDAKNGEETLFNEVNRTCIDGTSPLYISVENGCYEIVKKLLESKANVNHQIDSGSTAIFVACQNGNVEILNLLLKHNGSPLLCRNDGYSPLFVACAKNRVCYFLFQIIQQNNHNYYIIIIFIFSITNRLSFFSSLF